MEGVIVLPSFNFKDGVVIIKDGEVVAEGNYPIIYEQMQEINIENPYKVGDDLIKIAGTCKIGFKFKVTYTNKNFVSGNGRRFWYLCAKC